MFAVKREKRKKKSLKFTEIENVKKRSKIPFGLHGNRTSANLKAIFDLQAGFRAPSSARHFHIQKTKIHQRWESN